MNVQLILVKMGGRVMTKLTYTLACVSLDIQTKIVPQVSKCSFEMYFFLYLHFIWFPYESESGELY